MVKLGKVVDLFNDGKPKILFDGESVPSNKKYKELEGVTLNVNDRVMLVAISGTYIIVGKIKEVNGNG